MITHYFYPQKTGKFSCYQLIPNAERLLQSDNGATMKETGNPSPCFIFFNWNCPYTRKIIQSAIERRREYCQVISDILHDPRILQFHKQNCSSHQPTIVQLCDFENIQWEYVLSERTIASSYLVRKGLARKAQLSLQIQRFLKKSANSILGKAVPETHIIETWEIFPDQKTPTSSLGVLGFDVPQQLYDWNRTSIRDRLKWQFANNIELLFLRASSEEGLNQERSKINHHQRQRQKKSSLWILKPSMTNKGEDISILSSYEELLETLEEQSSIREWVLQRYIDNPLLLHQRRHKFHFRVYILCIGALQVFFYEEILVLFAAHRYNNNDYCDIYSHLTNTARAAETAEFDEAKYVKTMRDLPELLMKEYPQRFSTEEFCAQKIDDMLQQMKLIVHDLFQSYENEYSIFTPMTNCFELFGLDFIVDEDFQLFFLECNPGPDFRQTGQKLSLVIERLFESVFRLVIDFHSVYRLSSPKNLFCEDYQSKELQQDFFHQWIPSFKLVYSKSWSVNQLVSGGMTFIES